MVDDRIIEKAGALFSCDSIVKGHSKALRSAGDLIKDVSGIDCEHVLELAENRNSPQDDMVSS
jgi:hypothetical protein